jgi:Ca-activated chloride channel family protein
VSLYRPLYLLLLLLLVPLILTALGGYRRGRISRARLSGNPEGSDPEANDIFEGFFVKTFLSSLFFCGVFVCSVLALADISWGKEPAPEDHSGLDVMLVLDVSRSMLAQDAQPYRLRAAADIALELVQGLGHARFGVVAFKGGAVQAVPLTEDRQILETFFQQISPAVVRAPGTSVESGLEEALGAFPAGTASHKVIVLLSDGESLSDFTGGSAGKAGAEGIPIFAVGLGATSGSTIRMPDGDFLTGKDGRPVVTRLNAEALMTVADLSGGEYFSARETAAGLLAERLRDFEESRGRMGFRLVPVRRYRSFLLAGFALLWASILVRSIKWEKG